MGADAYAYLFLGVDFNDIYEHRVEKEEYDLHDPKTGQKTGQKGVEKKEYYVNIHNEQKSPDDIYSLPIEEKYIHNLSQEGDERIVGIKVARVADEGGGSIDIPMEKILACKEQFDAIIGPHLNGVKIEPKLVLNLYWSY
jgi:hypothetical protein